MISPVDIRQHVFSKKTIGGYDPEEVRAFLTSLAKEWEDIQADNKRLKSELHKAQELVKQYKDMEAIMHQTLTQAEQSSKYALEQSRREAELKLHEAEQQAQNIIRRAYEEKSKIEQELASLYHRKEEVLTHFRIFLQSQLERIQSFSIIEMPPLTQNISPAHTPVQPSNLPTTTPTHQTESVPTLTQSINTYDSGRSFFDKALHPTAQIALVNDLVNDL